MQAIRERYTWQKTFIYRPNAPMLGGHLIMSKYSYCIFIG